MTCIFYIQLSAFLLPFFWLSSIVHIKRKYISRVALIHAFGKMKNWQVSEKASVVSVASLLLLPAFLYLTSDQCGSLLKLVEDVNFEL